MTKTLKISFKFILLLIAIGSLILILNWQRALQLYHTMTLFDEEVIVENFTHMERLFPTIEIASTSKPYYFDSKPAELPKTFLYQEEARSMDEFITRSQTTALVIIKGDAITHESYYKGTSAEDRRISWSMSKSFLSAIFGVAVEQGAIKNLNEAVTDYVPELMGSGYEGVSIKHVLQMSSGIHFNEDYGDFTSDINRFGRVMALGGSFDEFASELINEREPGTYLHYVSIDTHVLGMVLRKATGQNIVKYFNKYLWSEIQPEASTLFITDTEGEPMVLGGLNMRTRDFAKFGKLYLDKGRWNGKQIIPEAWVNNSVTPGEDYLKPGKREGSDMLLGYGYQWWIPVDADQEFMAIGIYDQFIYVNQKANVVIVKNSANRNFMDNNFESAHESVAAFRAIAQSLAITEEAEVADISASVNSSLNN